MQSEPVLFDNVKLQHLELVRAGKRKRGTSVEAEKVADLGIEVCINSAILVADFLVPEFERNLRYVLSNTCLEIRFFIKHRRF